MSVRATSVLTNLRRFRTALTTKTPDDDLAELLEQIAMDRVVLVLDGVAESEMVEFATQWVYFNSPPGQISRGNTVLEWLIRLRGRFLLMDFHPDNIQKLWNTIRSNEHPSILQFIVEATTHFRMRVIATEDELLDLYDHLGNALSFIHRADKRVIDKVTEDDGFVDDNQFFDELPSPRNIIDQLTANPWLLPIVYLHRLTVDEIELMGELVYKQTMEHEKKTKTYAVATPPTGLESNGQGVDKP